VIVNQKIAIIAAPNGARKQKTDHPALPVSIQEIVTDVIACRDAGAAMVHVHARDSQGQHTLAVDDNQRLFDALHKAVGRSVMVQLTTEAMDHYTPEQQMTLIQEVCPMAASFALRELIPDDSHVNRAARFFGWVADQGMLAQHILYDRADVERYLALCRDGVLPRHGRHTLLVLGRYHPQQLSMPVDIAPFLNAKLLEQERWGSCAFGRYEHQCLTATMLLGGDVRVGFENNHLDLLGEMAKDNASQVFALAQQAKALNISLHDALSYKACLTS
jgi:uncharacterized protein (DUF849 family)